MGYVVRIKVIVGIAVFALLGTSASFAMKPSQAAHKAHVLKHAGPGVKVVQTPGIKPIGRHVTLPAHHPHAIRTTPVKPKTTIRGHLHHAAKAIKHAFTRPFKR